jgi:hypothetical protein
LIQETDVCAGLNKFNCQVDKSKLAVLQLFFVPIVEVELDYFQWNIKIKTGHTENNPKCPHGKFTTAQMSLYD